MNQFKNKVAVITGGASGFGKEFATIAASLGMKLVLGDVQRDALDATVNEFKAQGVAVVGQLVDVSKLEQVQALADTCMNEFGEVNLVFNNAGVGAGGGLIWESSAKDWDWVLGVNVFGVIHGVRVFTPLMLAAAKANPEYQGYIVNTASMAGLLTPPTMGVYNVSKHSVVALTETLYHDLSLVTDQISCSVLCPYFVPTGIAHSERNRPPSMTDKHAMTTSQRLAQAMSVKAVSSGKVSANDVAQLTFEAIRQSQFYIYSHPQSLSPARSRFDCIVSGDNPPDPYEHKPELRQEIMQALRAE